MKGGVNFYMKLQDNNEIDSLREIINKSDNIVFFGGAGVSTESNIPDFRSENGLYGNDTNKLYSPEEMLSHRFFLNHEEEFFKFVREKMIYPDAKPNKAHLALSKLESKGKLKAIITQNIDDLHQKAGSKNVIELHGSLYKNYCVKCKRKYSLEYVLKSKSIVPRCSYCGGTVRPDVVLYEEPLNNESMEKAISFITKADTLIIGGTSLVVYPAAGLIRYFKGGNLILINKTPTKYDNKCHLVIKGSIGDSLDKAIT